MLSNPDDRGPLGIPRDHWGHPIPQAEHYRQLLQRAQVRDDLAGGGLIGLARMLTHERLREGNYELLGSVTPSEAQDYIGAGIECAEAHANWGV